MFETAQSIWSFFCPPDPPFSEVFGANIDPVKIEEHMKALSRWRLKVSLTLFALIIGAIWAIFCPLGLVQAGDLDTKISKSVSQAVQEIKTEQTKMKADVSEIKQQTAITNTALTELLKTSRAQTICQLVSKKLRAAADAEQDKYKAIAGEFYPESRCGG